MILLNIRDYILKQQEITLIELASHFQIPESAIKKMADHWLQKKIIDKIIQQCDSIGTSICGNCATSCALKLEEKASQKPVILYRVCN
ncbi:FeoC-like transcriptional regulator [Ignatzschineria rhizosphaerae]|uniref:FeoC-like transcriptional regulator n=1 Tax=Ignatzschineria rhizosphaerae TaxID=2923279 RepID=A0ABY3X029_9GAMM|nr:FeoC-like transcriptional regulator [Ignatzschineria rhizosphaerae]UNM95645.1 FeoC-like transcriptional regulator [Ignatzschineria rhizosphaerae]